MNTRSIKIAVITAGLATAPMLSVAATATVAMDSCVKAFMTSLSTTVPKRLKLREAHLIDDHIVGDSSELMLTARDAQDNHPIARALCTVNTWGQVIDLHQEPLQGADSL
jgi:hypothetical protein